MYFYLLSYVVSCFVLSITQSVKMWGKTSKQKCLLIFQTHKNWSDFQLLNDFPFWPHLVTTIPLNVLTEQNWTLVILPQLSSHKVRFHGCKTLILCYSVHTYPTYTQKDDNILSILLVVFLWPFILSIIKYRQ